MTVRTVYGTTLTNAYHKALLDLQSVGEISDCADWNTTQKECNMTMVVLDPIREPMISKCFIGGQKELQQYVMEMLDGILDFEIEKGNWKYTYHDRMTNYPSTNERHSSMFGKSILTHINQVEFVVDELKRNPSSRRAVIMIRDSSDIGSDDPACLQHIQYFIRNGKLECDVLFRSNDACKATFMNAFALIMLQKKIADELGVSVGTYVHRANSFHCYEKDFDLLNGYCNRISSGDNLTYRYIDDWKDVMESYTSEILESVDKLRR